MDRDPDPAAAERMKASIKEAIGKLTGDPKAQAEGRAEKAKAEIPNTAASAEGEPENVTRK
ncbi:CsbD family protein [Muricoccus aerilatus]|uniref:CsbD family protein n=1 Tax=Muricoccus aerilatus TaxID=452982 RepID=UPI0005C14FAD|nr:CsbD family protein [Roseomonas aerilata]